MAVGFELPLQRSEGVVDHRKVEAQDDVAAAFLRRVASDVGAREYGIELAAPVAVVVILQQGHPQRLAESAWADQKGVALLLQTTKQAGLVDVQPPVHPDASEVGLPVGNARRGERHGLRRLRHWQVYRCDEPSGNSAQVTTPSALTVWRTSASSRVRRAARNSRQVITANAGHLSSVICAMPRNTSSPSRERRRPSQRFEHPTPAASARSLRLRCFKLGQSAADRSGHQPTRGALSSPVLVRLGDDPATWIQRFTRRCPDPSAPYTLFSARSCAPFAALSSPG